MSHHHHHAFTDGYKLDQFCKVGICGLLGGIVLVIWKADLLSKFKLLADPFIGAVYIGAVVLLVLSLLRVISLWSAARGSRLQAVDCHHEHGACGHAVDDGHDHGFSPWRYAVMMLPLMLSGLVVYLHVAGLNLVYSAEHLVAWRSHDPLLADGPDVPE